MKNLYLLRHGKSSWKYNELSDFERPLNERGRRDAPFMGNLIKKQGISPDLILSSPALRAYFTARTVAMILEYPLENIATSEMIYEAGLNDLYDVLKQVKDDFNNILMTGHNPGFTSFSNSLSNKYIDNIPTCGLVSLELDIASWSEIEADCGKVKFFEYPKKYFPK